MFETMDASREAYEQLEGQKEELELLWKQEKDKLRATQMVGRSKGDGGIMITAYTLVLGGSQRNCQ